MDNAERYRRARLIETGVFQSLMNAYRAEEEGDTYKANGFFKHADKLEQLFKRDFGMHYGTAIELGAEG